MGRTKESVTAALADLGLGGEVLRESRSRTVALAGDTYLVWGVIPSPLAVRTAESILALYSGVDAPPNRIFYACYAGTHSSVLAGSLHLGLLTEGKRVSDLPLFDRRIHADMGVPAFLGVDRYGSEVYVLGTGWLSQTLEKRLCGLIELASPRANACVCSVRGFLDLPARIGGFASRRISLVWPGRELIALSLGRKRPEMEEAVGYCLDLSKRWKDNEGQLTGEVIWLDGSKSRRSRVGGGTGQHSCRVGP